MCFDSLPTIVRQNGRKKAFGRSPLVRRFEQTGISIDVQDRRSERTQRQLIPNATGKTDDVAAVFQLHRSTEN